jgi:heptosyltransferase II
VNKLTPQKILVINTKYLGDLIVSTPALRALRRSYPSASISLLVRSIYAGVLKGNPNVDEIIGFDFSIKKWGGLKRLKAEYGFVKQLRRRNFDTVISLQAGDRYTQWAFLCGAKRRIGPGKQNMSFLLTDKVAVYEDTISYLDYYLELALAGGAKENGKKTEFVFDGSGNDWLNGFLTRHGIVNNDTIVGIHPGAGEPARIWPLENFIALINRLLENKKLKVILILGPGELNIADRFNSGFSERVIIADTSESIQNLALLIRKSDLFISHDSGAHHLAAALDVPSITLMPEDKITTWKFYDELKSQHFLIGKKNSTDPENQFLDLIDPSTVYSKAIEILQNGNRKS